MGSSLGPTYCPGMIELVVVSLLVTNIPPSQGIMSTWLDMMTRCEGECYYYPDVEYDTNGTLIRGAGVLNDNCRNFVFGPTGRPDSQGSSAISDIPCRYAVSIQPYHPGCDTFDRQPLNDRLCQYYNRQNTSNLYSITVARRYDVDGCDLRLNRNPPFDIIAYKNEYQKAEDPPTTRGACNVWDENVAFTLSTSQETNLTSADAEADKIYYVCTNEGITAYPFDAGQNISINLAAPIPLASQRITLAEPYADNPPGVLWSRVRKPPGERTIICTVILSSARFAYRTSNWLVEYVRNSLEFKHEILPQNLRPQYIHLAENDNSILWFKVAEAKIRRHFIEPNLVFSDFLDHENRDLRVYNQRIVVLRLQNVQASSNVINLSSLPAANSSRVTPPQIDPVRNADTLTRIDGIYATCRDKRAMCFNFPEEEGCQSREKCHMLVVIEQLLDFERLHIDLLTHPKAPHPIVMPYSYGWMGLAFSEDARMGGEAVFTCGYKGKALNCAEADRAQSAADSRRGGLPLCAKIYITVNLRKVGQLDATVEEKNNYYAGEQIDPQIGDYQQLIENANIEFGEVPSETEPRVLCSFDIRTRDYTNVSGYPKRPTEILRYDLLTREYFVLMATGRSVTSDWQIAYHGQANRGSGAEMKFSRRIYDDSIGVGGDRGHIHR